jgi:hypothetical protein
LYKKEKEALDIQQGYYKQQAEGELNRNSMIRQWGKCAMGYQSLIQLSRDKPDEFTELSDIWMRREKMGLH